MDFSRIKQSVSGKIKKINFDKIKQILFAVCKSLVTAFAVLCLACGIIPLLILRRSVNTGNIALICYGILLLAVVIVKGKRRAGFCKALLYWTRAAVAALLALCFAVGLFISFFMIKYASFNMPPAADSDGSGGTVVVLGCHIYGTSPSKLLKGRLDAAIVYLNSHEASAVIVSGGQGDDEIISEALAMKNYLTENGISEDRIIMEDKSTNTDENIRFTGDIISERGLPDTLYIVTDTFHSYRAHLFAEKCGFKSYNISSDVYWPLIGEYWVRDILGILHMKFTPNWDLKG